jgi:hypothetical protein
VSMRRPQRGEGLQDHDVSSVPCRTSALAGPLSNTPMEDGFAACRGRGH